MFCVCVFKKENRYYIFFQSIFVSFCEKRSLLHTLTFTIGAKLQSFCICFCLSCIYLCVSRHFETLQLSLFTRSLALWDYTFLSILGKTKFCEEKKVLIEFSLTRMATLNNKFCLCDKFSCLFVLFLRRKIIRG